MKIFRALAAALALATLAAAAQASEAIGAAALHARRGSLAPQLASNAFGGPLVLESQQAAHRIEGDVYAVLEHPYVQVATALADPQQWCEILVLHLNTKQCRAVDGGTRLEVRVGRKEPQPVRAASLLAFRWRPAVQRPDYLWAQMDAADGPYDTRDYRLVAEAVPLEGGRTFLHLGYGLAYGGASDLAMRLYLATVGHDKAGFTRLGPHGGEEEGFVGGMRGVVERNTMRYYLALDAYLDSLSVPPGQQLERRLQAWFAATEKYPRQLHEVERDAYLRMKREEVRRQRAAS